MKPFYWLARSSLALLGKTLLHFRVLHPERLIEVGPAILACNHESFLDPPLVAVACRREIHFLARRSLLEHHFLHSTLPHLNVVPVDIGGRDRVALKTIIRLVSNGNRVLIFPEGARTLDGNLQPAQPGVGLIVAKTAAPVVPMRIFGARAALPRGSGMLRPHPVSLVVGHPIHPPFADVDPGRDGYRQIGERIMAAIAAIRPDGTEEVPPHHALSCCPHHDMTPSSPTDDPPRPDRR